MPEKKGKFSYYGQTGMPEIPHITDVLYAAGYISNGLDYSFCHPRCPQYIQNVHMVIVACIFEICAYFSEADMPTSEGFTKNARRVIAKTIIEMTPDHVPQNNTSLLEARQVLAEE